MRLKKSIKLSYNDIYYFSYKSELAKKDKIHIYDRYPLVVFLDLERKDGKVLGINMHWIPKQYRKKFLKYVNETFTEDMIKAGKKRRSPYFPRLFYANIKSNSILKRLSYMAIRIYFTKNILSIEKIPKEMWDILFTSKTARISRGRFAKKTKNYKI